MEKEKKVARELKSYYIGLDVGTDSIGWAVTDENYELLRERGRDFWGVYLFDAAETAVNRRAFRTARRRAARTRQRIDLLQELFSEKIARIDFSFFRRLAESKLNVEDKTVGGKYTLFNDDGFTDKEYNKQYPTIYHLRAAFLNAESAKKITDVRLLYLAVHHIIKSRGHFLFEGQTIAAEDRNNVKNAFCEINTILSETDGQPFDNIEKLDDALTLLSDKKTSKNDKEKRLRELLSVGAKDKQNIAIIKAFIGKKTNFKDFFNLDEDPEVKDFCFDDADFTEEKFREGLQEDEYSLLCNVKKVYDWAVLTEILGGHRYLSEAMVEKYAAHKKDLELLKAYVEQNCPERKKEVFHLNDGKTVNYAAYVGLCGKKRFKKSTKDEFYKYLKTNLKVTDPEILKKIEDGTFLQKLRTGANGVIPYQIHKAELDIILKNAAENFPFLADMQDGYTVADKIKMLLTFRVPYYVGPLNDAHKSSGFAWVKKYDGIEKQKITPWNFSSIVDENASENEFIQRMTNKCTYLSGEDVLPKASICYQRFAFLNELNNLTFKGKRLDYSGRKAIIEYAEKEKKITIGKVAKYLERLGYIEKDEGKKENFGGLESDFKNSLSSYVFMRRVFGEDYNEDICEKIILWLTVMGDKNRVAERIKRELKLSDDLIKSIKDFNCSGWGRLSEKFLKGLYECTPDGELITNENGEPKNILGAMDESGLNLMELLSNNYGFINAVALHNAGCRSDDKITYSTVEDLYCSPSVKRAIWRTVCIAKEIEKVRGDAPSRVFIEMARGEEENKKGKPPVSRRQRIIDLYKSIKDESREWMDEIESTPEIRFSSDKLLLYYLQKGRSAYSGKPINIQDVFNTNVVDIDHIYPQSKIKDDSLDNRVLAYKTENQQKKDIYPVKDEIRSQMYGFWLELKDGGLMSEKKFDRLTRSTPLTIDEMSDFVNRQLVETRQSTKAIAQILKKLFSESDIVYSKARNVSDFKEEVLKVKKVREVNDLHHAKDAYLNIVVGNTYFVKFNRNAKWFFTEHQNESYTVKDPFAYEVKGAWKPSYKSRVREIALKNDCRVVRFTSMGHGGLFNATIKTKGANDKLIPLKANGAIADTSKYGGYDSATTAYFSLVQSDGKKGERKISIEAIPIYIDKLGKEKVLEFLVKNAELKNPRILIEKIKINSLLSINGAYVWLRGKSGIQIKLCNANQLILNEETYNYLKHISVYLDRNKKARKEFDVDERDKITKDQNLQVYHIFIDKLSQKPYSLLSVGGQAKLLIEQEQIFINLSLEEQCKVLFEIMKLMQCNATLSDLKKIGGVGQAGVLLRNKFLSPDEKVLLITQSPTGYYRNTVNLTDYYKA